MKLPNAELATVAEPKVTLYLLNKAHPIGGTKAAFFLKHGYKPDKWQVLAADLLLHALQNEVTAGDETPYGIRYAVDGTLTAPSCKSLIVRTAWFIDHGCKTPRFISAYPISKP